MTVKLYTATSLDGYIATENDDLQWLFEVDGEGDNGTGSFYAGIDVIVMGKKTYDYIIREESGQWAYGEKTVYVLSHTTHDNNDQVTFIKSINQIPEFEAGLINSTKNIWIMGGGQINRLFLEKHLVDEIIITIAPVLLGKGKELFPEGDYGENLQFVSSKTYGQFVELTYRVLR
ncbi:dihydrofolate reductase family protein [Lactococcus ileimucosae]|uniref:Dihydrofolate reductase family protein n=1 Tax=Lactococcus ileimucosae TaxID=2941329 RepID=A0ABV4D2K6_9LACT